MTPRQPKPGTPLERMTELTRRIVAVPKSEIPAKRKAGRRRRGVTVPERGIRPGVAILVRPVNGRRLRKIATSAVVSGYEFEVVWACRPEEWDAAKAEGREPDAMPWPANDVVLA